MVKLYSRKTKSSILLSDKGNVDSDAFEQSLKASISYRNMSLKHSKGRQMELTPRFSHSKFNRLSITTTNGAKNKRTKLSSFRKSPSKKSKRKLNSRHRKGVSQFSSRKKSRSKYKSIVPKIEEMHKSGRITRIIVV